VDKLKIIFHFNGLENFKVCGWQQGRTVTVLGTSSTKGILVWIRTELPFFFTQSYPHAVGGDKPPFLQWNEMA